MSIAFTGAFFTNELKYAYNYNAMLEIWSIRLSIHKLHQVKVMYSLVIVF